MARKAKIKAPGSDTTPDRRNDAFPSGPSEAEYKVGPGRPPKEYQFKQGQSGNPKGRKRKEPSLLPDLKQLFESAFNQKVKVTQGGAAAAPHHVGRRHAAARGAICQRRPACPPRRLLDRRKAGVRIFNIKERARRSSCGGAPGHPGRLCRTADAEGFFCALAPSRALRAPG